VRRLEQRVSKRPDYWAETVVDSLERAAKGDEAAGRPELARSERQHAREVIRRELARIGPDAGALNDLAWFLAKHNLFLPQALQAAERAVALSPREAGILDTLAEVHFRMGHPGQAIALEARVLAMKPRNQVLKDHLARYRNGKQQTRGKTVRGKRR
jgi:predicted Zn-dependent protease